ncbi:hypothetical protein ACIO93_33745 [Streptomyces sp. NPDC087903]|uniref:hypothetical protein n=1 Tax=Streptomyces sp. NPDC087903 TaxID=3365819 RepID=UPI0038142BC7
MTEASQARWTGYPYAKVPALTAIFWGAKLLTPGLGESASDFMFLGGHWITLIVTAVAVAGAFVWQFRTSRYQAVPYWTAVLGVAVFGTAEADIMAFVVGVPLPLVAVGYAAATAAVLAIWYRSEGTLSVHSITTRRRETFYWLTVMCSFALGTSAGDLTASTLGLGFVGSMALFGVAIVVPWILHRCGTLHSVTAFWAAYGRWAPRWPTGSSSQSTTTVKGAVVSASGQARSPSEGSCCSWSWSPVLRSGALTCRTRSRVSTSPRVAAPGGAPNA